MKRHGSEALRLAAWGTDGQLLALTVTELSILMLPLDVGNRNSCAEHVALTACSLTLPMRSLWYAVYMTMGLLVAVVIPFTIYYYEADSDRTTMQRWRDASLWVLLTDVVIGATVGVAYGACHHTHTHTYTHTHTHTHTRLSDSSIVFKEDEIHTGNLVRAISRLASPSGGTAANTPEGTTRT